MSKFKVGDKLRVIKRFTNHGNKLDDEGIKIGDKATVTNIWSKTDPTIGVDISIYCVDEVCFTLDNEVKSWRGEFE